MTIELIVELLVIVMLQTGEACIFAIAVGEYASSLAEEFLEIMSFGKCGRVSGSAGERIEKEHVCECGFATSVKT